MNINSFKSSVKNSGKDSAESSHKNLPKDVAKGSSKGSVKNSSEDQPKDVPVSEKRPARKGLIRRLPSIIGIVICIVLVPLLIMNLTIIIKSYINPDKVPDFFGIKPFVVLSGSMEPAILGGDLVVTQTVDPATLKVDDIISFKSGNAVVTHRIIELTDQNGELAFITKGDANNSNDGNPITSSQVEGIYLFKIDGLGHIALFMQTPVGMLIFVGIPLFGFIIYDIIRRRLANQKETSKDSDAQAEIERLKAELAKKSSGAELEENETVKVKTDKVQPSTEIKSDKT